MELLKELCEAYGAPGFEDRIREIYRREMGPLVDRIESDGIGNLIAIKEGKGDNPRKIMLAGHMDEIGFVVSHIDKNGFLRVSPLGGFDPKTLIAKRVCVISNDGSEMIGVLGTKPIHIMTPEERKKLPEIKDLFVDLGLPAEEVKSKIDIGCPVTLSQDFIELGNLYSAKSMDNRVSIYTLIEAVRRAGETDATIVAVATAQEEIGVRGALTAAHKIAPDLGIAVDVTLACDVPSAKAEEYITEIGKGVAIKVLDSASISSPQLVAHAKKLAKEREIPYQLEILPRGGTDAAGIQRGGDAVAALTLSVPTRYVHSVVETIDARDLEGCVNLLAAFLQTAHEVDLSY